MSLSPWLYVHGLTHRLALPCLPWPVALGVRVLQLRFYGAQRCDLYAAHQMIVRQRLRALVDRRALLSGEAVTGLVPPTEPAPPHVHASTEPQEVLSSTATRKSISFLSSGSFKAQPPPSSATPGPLGREGSLSSLGGGTGNGGGTGIGHCSGVPCLSASTSTSSVCMDVSGDHSDAPVDGREGGAGEEQSSEAYDSLFGEAAPQSLKRGSQEATPGKAVNRSLHRRGKTGKPHAPTHFIVKRRRSTL